MKNNRFLLVALMLFSSLAQSEQLIKVGMTAALTGSAAELGLNMRAGMESYFSMVNEQGGVKGRFIELIVKDDGYEPERAAKNMRALIDQDNVLAVIGNVGTPTAIVTVPIAQEKKILLFGAFSGGSILRPEPASRYIINYRASYDEETAEMVGGLLSSGIKPQQIAFFTQADGYGDTAYHGAIKALKNAGFKGTEQLTHGRYTRNTLNVENAVAAVLDTSIEPKVIILAADYKASAKFITLLKREIPDMLFLNLSFVGSYALREALGGNADNVIITQVVPSLDSTLPIVEEYLEALKQYDPNLGANFVSLEGFIVAKIFHTGLLNIEQDITKESIIDGIEAISGIDIGLGEHVYYDQQDHQAINKLWLTCFCGGKLNQFDWRTLQEMMDVE
ncbi:MAG: ABC transporter substrate-binding protein [Methylophaga sp.]|nr:ABC transporter substrate-binding protein [Methylophaga sp.]